ncbi:MAG: hypothetical protein ABI977_11135 [Acidobacteriota bacterium]
MGKLFAVIALILICYLNGYAQAPLSNDKLRAEKILAQARQAKGGLEKLKKVEDLVYSGDFISYMPSGTTRQKLKMYLAQGRKVRTDVDTNASGFDGSTGWFNDNPLDERMLYESERRAAREWFLNLLVVPKDMKLTAIARPDEKVGGKPVEVIAVTIGIAMFNLYFDKQSHLILKVSYGVMNGKEEITIEEVQEDYQDVKGIKFAHRQLGYENGKLSGEIVINEYQPNTGIDPQKFARK